MKNQRSGVDRRSFLGIMGLGILTLATGCQAGNEPAPEDQTAPGQPTRQAWQWEIRYVRGTPAVDATRWRLRLDGLVEQPLELTLDELKAFPVTEQRSRLKCVECWSAPAVWRGVAPLDILARVKLLPNASHVTFHATDGYDTTLPLATIKAPRTLFVYGMDGGPLPPDHGAPLRLIVPSKYGYKNCKAIQRIELTDRPVPGYWERAGYGDDGTIGAGLDHPLDFGDARRINGGEITNY